MLSHRGSRDAIKWGVRNGIQRYKCRKCQSIFSARSICHALNHKRLTISKIQNNMCQTPVFKRRFSTRLFTKPLTINILENQNVPDIFSQISKHRARRSFSVTFEHTDRHLGHVCGMQACLKVRNLTFEHTANYPFALNRATKKIGQQVHQNSRIQNQVQKYRIWSESCTS